MSGYAEAFASHYLPGNVIDGVYVNFPDPWPKDRHAKHRIFKEPFIADMHRIMKKDAIATLVTDDPTYLNQMEVEMGQRFTLKTRDPIPEYGSSFFERLWLEKGRSINFLRYAPVLESTHSQFTLDEQPFIPKIFDGPLASVDRGFNISVIKLDATLDSDLNWSIPETDDFVIYEFDFGLSNPNFSLVDPMPLATFKRAIEHFSETLVTEKTLGAILYRGEANFAKSFKLERGI